MPSGATEHQPTTTMKLSGSTLKAKNMELNEAIRSTTALDPQNLGGLSSNKTGESDPNGRNPHELGAKLDAGKISVWRGVIDYFPRAVEAVAGISTHGAIKYAWKGWESVPEGVERYSDALVRHLIGEAKGEVLDADSGLLHAAHTAWNALAVLELKLREKNVKQTD